MILKPGYSKVKLSDVDVILNVQNQIVGFVSADGSLAKFVGYDEDPLTGRMTISQDDYEIRQRLRASLMVGGIPVAMAAPPTISASSASSTLAKFWAWDSGSLTLMGANWIQVGANPRAQPDTVHYAGDDSWRYGCGAIQFISDAPTIEFNGLYDKFRVFVDELDGKGWQLAGQSLGDSVSMLFVPISFGSRKTRCYRLETGYIQFVGIKTSAIDTVLPLPSETLSAVLIGDSFSEGSGATQPELDGYPRKLAWLFGLPKLRISGSGGTGILQNFSPRVNYQTRFSVDVLSSSPDLVFIQCTRNDELFSAQEQVNGLLSLIGRCRSVGAMPIVIGVWNTASVSSIAAANNAALKAATIASGCIYLDWYDLINGGGHVGATTGTGNGDLLICAADTTHPSDLGHTVRASYLSALLAAAVA